MKGLYLIAKAMDRLEYLEKKDFFLERLLQNQPKRVRADEQMTFLQE